MKRQTACHAKLTQLLSAYHQSPSAELHRHIVRLNAGLVRKVVYRVCRCRGAAYEQLEAAGFQGLATAIEQYNPGSDGDFSTFALSYICQALAQTDSSPKRLTRAAQLFSA